MPATYKGNKVTLENIGEYDFGFSTTIRLAMLDNEGLADNILEAYLDAENRRDGLHSGEEVYHTMYGTPPNTDDDDTDDDDTDDDDTDADDTDADDTDADDTDADDTDADDTDADDTDADGTDADDTDADDVKAVKVDTAYDFDAATAKLATIDTAMESMADQPIIIESLATTRSALVAEINAARIGAAENAQRAYKAEKQKEIEPWAFEFRNGWMTQANRRLDNITIQFIRNGNANARLGYEHGDDEESPDDVITMIMKTNHTDVPFGATHSPNRRISTPRATTGSSTDKAQEREAKAAEKAAEKEAKAVESARIELLAASGRVNGLTLLDTKSGQTTTIGLLDFVEKYCPDVPGGKQSRHFKGGWRINIKSSFPQKSVIAAESLGIKVTATN